MVNMSTPTSRIFTIEVDGKPTIVFEASSWSEAKELSREEWFRADLSVQMSAGALPAEVARFEQFRDALGRPPDNLELGYLVELDG
jgi:hypothetical protein